MTEPRFDHNDARSVRRQWFRYLDTIEPLRADLHGFCLRLTNNIWDAEDLVQDTLLKGFGMTARGDFHGPDSPVRNIKAYLFRTATNAWLDEKRRQAKTANEAEEQLHHDPDPAVTRDALRKAAHLASPQELAALLLKDVYGFTLEEVADFIGTTEGTVKSALSRARGKMNNTIDAGDRHPADSQLVDALVDAINSGEPENVIDLMAEHIQISVCNVGGGRGRRGIWSAKSLVNVSARAFECDGETVILMFRKDQPDLLYDVLKVSGDEKATRLKDYCYAPETLAYVADKAGFRSEAIAYHQPWQTIDGEMVPTTSLPWQEEQSASTASS